MMRSLLLSLVVLGSTSPAADAAPAARAGDPTTHGGLVAIGSPNVLIGGVPAARLGDTATCPIVVGNPPVAHVGGPIVTAAATVLINGVPAARAGDSIAEATGPGSTIAAGSPSVLIGSTAARAPVTSRRSRRLR